MPRACPTSSQAPNPGEWTSSRGSAKPIACDATGGSDLDAAAGSGTIDRRQDGPVQHRLRGRERRTDQRGLGRDGRRRAGASPRPEGGARRPAAPQAPLLILQYRQIRQRSTYAAADHPHRPNGRFLTAPGPPASPTRRSDRCRQGQECARTGTEAASHSLGWPAMIIPIWFPVGPQSVRKPVGTAGFEPATP